MLPNYWRDIYFRSQHDCVQADGMLALCRADRVLKLMHLGLILYGTLGVSLPKMTILSKTFKYHSRDVESGSVVSDSTEVGASL